VKSYNRKNFTTPKQTIDAGGEEKGRLRLNLLSQGHFEELLQGYAANGNKTPANVKKPGKLQESFLYFSGCINQSFLLCEPLGNQQKKYLVSFDDK